ncbi:uncharacterized protein LOC141631855 [Silene latifolia]|uniref:uncharacterized protein LOC141631855 n=1 Tax=Silene latifolia TaxID=37657 RepID=UPI003D7842F6
MACAVRRDSGSSSTSDWRALREQERQARRKLSCSHCNATGHEEQSCFIKSQKFPEWWGDCPRTLDEICARSQTRVSGRSPARANMVFSAPSSSSSHGPLNGMPPDLIIDTRASNHVTGYDPSTMTTIGVGELWDGLYYLRAVVGLVVHRMSTTDIFNLWHKRLGHPPNKIVKLLPPISHLNADLEHACDICHFAKQSRNSFHLNNSKASAIFDLIHCDLWGPYRTLSSCGAKYFLTLADDSSRAVWNSFPYSDNTGSSSRVQESSSDESLLFTVEEQVLFNTEDPAASSNTGPEECIGDGTGATSVAADGADRGSIDGEGVGCANNDQTGSSTPPATELGRGKRTKRLPPHLNDYILETNTAATNAQPDSPGSTSSDEITALENNGTWELTGLPHGKKALGCRWVYKIKYKSDGSVERFKARLVIFGNHQVEGIDYGETFPPVVKMVTVRTLLTVSAIKNWGLHQMDVHNAFLHGDLSEEVYMKLPPGFSQGKEGKVCRLRKSLYGLRQAPRCWFAKSGAALRDYGFIQSHSDYSLFSYSKNEGIYLCQRKYALDIISESGLLGAKPAITPIEQHHQLGLASGALLDDAERYRRLVGRLVYLEVTRPDLSYAVHILSQFLHQPRKEHMDAALRVVRYLKGRPGQGILLRSDSSLAILGWCDSDYAGCPLTRRSVSGWIVFVGDSPVSWKTKKQQTVSLSYAEA